MMPNNKTVVDIFLILYNNICIIIYVKFAYESYNFNRKTNI